MMKSTMAYEYNVLPEKTNQKAQLDDIIENRIEEANEHQRQFDLMREEHRRRSNHTNQEIVQLQMN